MYLEISPRQAGKTTRLVQAAIQSLEENYDVYVVGYKFDYVKRIFNDNPSLKGATLLTASNLVNYDNSWFQDTRKRFFFDEFDFYRLNRVLLPVIPTGYYATTAQFIRKPIDYIAWHRDNLLRLLKANNHMYTSCDPMARFTRMPMDVFNYEIERTKDYLNDLEYKHQVLGEFNSIEPIDPRQLQ